jgi:transposase
VHPSSGKTEIWFSDKQDTELHSQMLEHVAKAMEVGPNKKVVLVLDGAAWHTSKKLRVPAGIELCFLPPFTPQMQPVERLWPLLDEPLVGFTGTQLEEVEKLMSRRIDYLTQHPHLVQGHTHFHWWPEPKTMKQN